MFGGVGEGEWLEIALVAVDNKSPQNFAAGPHRSQNQYLRGGYTDSFKSPPRLQIDLFQKSVFFS